MTMPVTVPPLRLVLVTAGTGVVGLTLSGIVGLTAGVVGLTAGVVGDSIGTGENGEMV